MSRMGMQGMVEAQDELTQLTQELEASLMAQYGPLLSAADLQTVLAYPSADAYRQAITRRTVPVPLFEIKRRRGRFALTRDVARYLACQRLGSDFLPRP